MFLRSGRPHAGADAIGDLLTLNTSGAPTFQQGPGKGGFAGKVSGSGRPARTLAVPFGDLNKDGRADLIARNAKVVGAGGLNGDGIGDLLAQDRANTLYRYFGKGDGTFGARAKLFSHWGGSYVAVVGVGDITGDGTADLVERDSAGDLYRNSGDGKGPFGGRVKIASGWQGYKGLF